MSKDIESRIAACWTAAGLEALCRELAADLDEWMGESMYWRQVTECDSPEDYEAAQTPEPIRCPNCGEVADHHTDHDGSRYRCTNCNTSVPLESELAQTAAPQPDDFERLRWTPVTDQLPKSEVDVLAHYRNTNGKSRIVKAMYVARWTVESSYEDDDLCDEYHEERDTYYLREGWYEVIENWSEYTSISIHEGEVTHWMPLPADPMEDE